MSDIHEEDRPGRLSIQHAVVDGILVVTVRDEIDAAVKDVLSEALLSEGGAMPLHRRVQLPAYRLRQRQRQRQRQRLAQRPGDDGLRDPVQRPDPLRPT
ncbi:hypothetical protein ACIPIU_04360 [Streptomyces massasporeus]|uniref:hypothetical protein n=1 Tax=Streptomyces massasporeus TaxID=67324 RepID=UPI0037F88F5D